MHNDTDLSSDSKRDREHIIEIIKRNQIKDSIGPTVSGDATNTASMRILTLRLLGRA